MRGPFRAAIAMLAGVAGLAVAAPALAATNQPIAQTGGAEATFTVAGVPMTVNVALDITTGDIKTVSVDPSAGLTATADSPTKVTFENTDGTTKVSVKAKKSSLSLGVKTGKLADLVGTHTWKADLFGAAAPAVPAAGAAAPATPAKGPSAAATVVTYKIGDDGTGAPTFEFVGDPTPLNGATLTKLGTWNGSKGDDDDSTSAGGRLAFDLNGFRKTLTVSVHVSNETDDGNNAGTASLRVTLQGRDIQTLPLEKLVGSKTWTGQLCDGSTGTIPYTVNADGTITVDAAAVKPAATVNSNRNGVTVKFATGDKVSIKLSAPTSGDASLKIDRRGKECTGTRVTAPDPSVGDIPVSTTAPGRKHGDHKGDDNANTTTTANPSGSTSSSVAANADTRTGGGRNRGGNGGGGNDNGND